MFYKPLDTKMERIKVLGLLRTSNIVIPDDFPTKKTTDNKPRDVCRALLNHNPDKRPSAQELLESGDIPLKMEDSQLDELLKYTLSQTNSTRWVLDDVRAGLAAKFLSGRFRSDSVSEGRHLQNMQDQYESMHEAIRAKSP